MYLFGHMGVSKKRRETLSGKKMCLAIWLQTIPGTIAALWLKLFDGAISILVVSPISQKKRCFVHRTASRSWQLRDWILRPCAFAVTPDARRIAMNCDGRLASSAILSPDLSISKSLGWWPTAIHGSKVTPLPFHLSGRSAVRAASAQTAR